MSDLPETPSPFIQDATADNFHELVIANSSKGPVLVNYWSKKVGPCIRQYPVLEKVVKEMGGNFLLVNLNADEYRSLAKDYGVTSLPTLKLFQEGEVIETRHGYQDESDLKRMMARYLPRASDRILPQALEAFQSGDTEKALVMLAEATMEDPQNIRLPLTMAKLLVEDGKINEADQLLVSMPLEQRDDEQTKQLRAQIAFIKVEHEAPDAGELFKRIEENPADCEALYQLGVHQALDESYEQALASFYMVMQADREYAGGAANRGLLTIFSMLGDDHPLVLEYRAKMQQDLH